MIRVKKTVWMLSILILIFCIFVSCGKASNKTSDNAGISSLFQSNVYSEYDNIVSIEPFHNGLAAFVIHVNDNTMHMSMTSGYWEGSYYYGYIDTKGKVIIEPKYECSADFSEIQLFSYGCVKVKDGEEREAIIDRTGAVRYRVGENQVSNIGKVAYGYFWVETETEKVSGNEYTVTYYRCGTDSDSITESHVFENMQAIVDSSNVSGYQSTLNEQYEYIVVTDADKRYFGQNDISYYHITGIPQKVNWTVDVSEIAEFGGAYCWYDTPKTSNNEQGAVAAVVLRNDQGVFFYATVDQTGKVLMQPRKDIAFQVANERELVRFRFSCDLCPALDTQSGMWGYIDPYGNWVIDPQFDETEPFSEDGYATVNKTTVIDTTGRKILSP